MTEITNLVLYLAEKYGIAINKDKTEISRSVDNCPLPRLHSSFETYK